MKSNYFCRLVLLGMLICPLWGCQALHSSEAAEDKPTAEWIFEDRPFDSDWRFLRADVPGAERPEFDDSSWRILDLPHD